MKRRSDTHHIGTMRFDVRKDFSPEQLCEIGAVCMAFNRLEGAIDFITSRSTGLDKEASKVILHKLSGIPAKIETIRAVAGKHLQLEESVWKDTLDKVKECKDYRDAVVHTQLVDSPLAIGETTQKGTIDHVLMSKEALSALYDFMVAVHNEFASLYYVIQARQEDLAKSKLADAQQPQPSEIHLQSCLELLDRDRRRRKELKPLPAVPNLSLDQQESDTLQARAKRSPRLASRKGRR